MRFLKWEGAEKQKEMTSRETNRKSFFDELIKLKKEFCIEAIKPEYNKTSHNKKLGESEYYKNSNLNIRLSIQELIISLDIRNDIIGYNSASAASYQNLSPLPGMNKEIIQKIDSVLQLMAHEEIVTKPSQK